jgi:hypothetical protein
MGLQKKYICLSVRDLVYWLDLYKKLPPSVVLLFFFVHALTQLFTAYFPVTSLRLILLSGVCIAAVM